MLYESGYDDFYKDNVGGSKATPEAALTGRSIVTHIDAGVYDGLPKMSLIIIQRGTNDCANWRNGNVQKGTAASTDKNTTYGAIKYICAYFSTRFPEARIVWSNIIYRGDGDWPEHTEYNNALLSICPDYGVEVFDLRTAIGITASNYTSYLRADKLHLNAAGEQLMKNAWKGFLS
jgi:lysophospholipase L1-like esterase